MSALSIPAADIEIVCDECHSKTVVENVPTAGATRGELFDLCQPRAVAKGWSVHRNRDGGRGFCCPACTAEAQKKLTGELPPYSADVKCPKCSHDQVATRYWSGLEIDAPLGVPREHLGRTCGRCGYSFVQGCADQKIESIANDAAKQPSAPPAPPPLRR